MQEQIIYNVLSNEGIAIGKADMDHEERIVMTNFYKLGTLPLQQVAKYFVYPSGTYARVWKTTWGTCMYEDYASAVADTVRWLKEEVAVNNEV